MQIPFEIDGKPALFRRNSSTGRTELLFGDQVICLLSPYRLSTQFEFSTRRELQHSVDGHDVSVVKIRPRTFGGLRDNTYTISVDGMVVAKATGY